MGTKEGNSSCLEGQQGVCYRTNSVPSEGHRNAVALSKHDFPRFVSSVPDEKKDILTCTLQSWYLLDVPVQVLLASPLTDFLLNKETMVSQGSEILLFPFLKYICPLLL